MRLISISATNLKGSTFTEPLAPVTVFVGGNFAGKSSRMDAVRLLLLGFLPELGNTSQATFGLSSGSEMSVEGDFDNGLRIRRRWFLKGNSVKKEEEVPKEIAESGVLAVMLNESEYFSKGPTERTNYVFANCPVEGSRYAPTEIAGRVDAAAGSPLEWKIALPVKSPQEFVADNVEHFKERAKAARDHADRMEKTVQGLAQIRTSEAPTESINALDADLATAQAERDAAQARRSDLAARESQSVNTETRRARLRRAVEMRPGAEAKIKAAEAELADLTASIDNDRWPEPGDVEAISGEAAEAKGRINAGVGALSREEATVRTRRAELAEIDGKASCPYCGASGDGWKTLRRAEIGEIVAKAEAEIARLAGTAKADQEALRDANARLGTAKAENDRLQQLNRRKTGVLSDLASFRAAFVSISDADRDLAELPPPVDSLSAAVGEADREVAAIDLRRRELNDRRKAVERRAQDLVRLAQAEEERDKGLADALAAKAAVDELKAIQQEMVKEAFSGILAKANGFFGSVLRSPLAFNDGEVGTWREGVWIGHKTMSGTERSLTYGAICAALASRSPVRIMAIDELARLDASNVGKLITAATGAIRDGVLDQFIGIDPRAELYEGVKDSAFLVRRIG